MYNFICSNSSFLSILQEPDDYESLPEGSSTSSHMLAGSCAGVMEHSIMYPVDCVKVSLAALTVFVRALLGIKMWLFHLIID